MSVFKIFLVRRFVLEQDVAPDGMGHIPSEAGKAEFEMHFHEWKKLHI